MDQSSCANTDDCHVTHYSFDWTIDLEKQDISACAELHVRFRHNVGNVFLDVHEALAISRVLLILDDGPAYIGVEFEVQDFCSFGRRLVIRAGDTAHKLIGLQRLRIYYVTSGEPAVTWLAPSLTLGQVAPMCFSMGHATLNRSLFPCQDTPRVRATFDAVFQVAPTSLGPDVDSSIVVACGAGRPEASHPFATAMPLQEDTKSKFKRQAVGGFPTQSASTCAFFFAMPQTLPSYLIGTFVCGRIDRRDESPRCAVWAEPELIDAAAREFGTCLETYLSTAELLFGPYQFEQYDVILMPKAFAYGGMENPRLTFLSPTLVVGDGSLTDTVAHEVAHSRTTYYLLLTTYYY